MTSLFRRASRPARHDCLTLTVDNRGAATLSGHMAPALAVGVLRATATAFAIEQGLDTAADHPTVQPTPMPATAEFFVPGALYRRGGAPGTPPDMLRLFRVEHVANHPTRGGQVAFGFVRTQADDAKWWSTVKLSTEGWTLVTESGDTL